MRRLFACALLISVLAGGAATGSDQPFRPRGFHNDSVHRYFPDLNSRFNAVRYGRWRALEIAWTVGINPDLDREFSSYLLTLLGDPPRYPPEPNLVAPRFSRGARPVFEALAWGQVLEQQLTDALAAPDATPELTQQRLARALAAYEREPHALRDPAPGAGSETAEAPVLVSEAARAAPVSARILTSGTALFIRSAEALAGTNFGEQRWRVMDTIALFDRSFAGEFGQTSSPEPEPPEPASQDAASLRPVSYRTSAPVVMEISPVLADRLDRLSRFRGEVFESLIPGGVSPEARRQRDAGLRELARRYGLSEEGIGEN
ncbi:MAG: hypothetical protein ABR576_12885 [Thermoanaerobaculia bacterium]